MKDHGRHPFFENVVFAFALVLALVIAWHAVRLALSRRLASARPGLVRDAAPSRPLGPAPRQDRVGSRTERGVSSIPTVRFDQPAQAKPRRGDVPAPHR